MKVKYQGSQESEILYFEIVEEDSELNENLAAINEIEYEAEKLEVR